VKWDVIKKRHSSYALGIPADKQKLAFFLSRRIIKS